VVSAKSTGAATTRRDVRSAFPCARISARSVAANLKRRVDDGYDHAVPELATPRLLLRQWRQADLDPFAALNADPEVMRYFPAALTKAQSDQFAAHVQATIARQGWGLWAVEVLDAAPFIGFVGLNQPRFQAHFTPAVEVGWGLDRRYWGQGYATEAARASLTFGFDHLAATRLSRSAPQSTTNPAA
jgi:RimJ/RimL family protein N-acetyltransferase